MNNEVVNNILPDSPTQAAHELIKISRTLLALAERESQALIHNDLAAFGILQDEKELIAERYNNASVEFRNRLEEFRGIDATLLDQMEHMQNELSEKMHSNNIYVGQIRKRAETKTQSTLFTVQELAQQKPIRFDSEQEERT